MKKILPPAKALTQRKVVSIPPRDWNFYYLEFIGFIFQSISQMCLFGLRYRCLNVPLMSIFSVYFLHVLFCLLCLHFLCTSCRYSLWCHLEMACLWHYRPAGVHCLLRQKKISSVMVILGIKCQMKNPSLLVTSTFKQIQSSRTDLSASLSSPSSLEGRWAKSAEQSQKIYILTLFSWDTLYGKSFWNF